MSTVHTNEAAISTATVEIKTLMVSNRQMTQAIFRQLEEAWAWDPDDPLLGVGAPVTLWGRVNYHFSGCCQGGKPRDHVNVVFSADGVLYRCSVLRHFHQHAEAAMLPQLFIAG